MGRYLTERERYRIEIMLKDGVKPKSIADILGKHYTTIYKEIEKGTVTLLNSDLTFREEYCADYAQRITNERQSKKGPDLKIGCDHKLAAYIEYLVKELRYSPYAVSQCIKKKGCFSVTLSEGTIYNYIDRGLFLNISNKDLTVKGKEKQKYDKIERPSYKKLRGKSIEDRPADVEDRENYGHWEIDTVYSGKNKSKCCLLVLSERKTRDEYIMKMTDRTLESVISALDNLERTLGTETFRERFKTITADNGSEFGDSSDMEKSCIDSGSRTSVYFCHPYSSFERGTNENINKLIRRFIPKGADISQYSDEEIKKINDWINNYPRRIFGGLSANEYKALLNVF